MNAVSSLPPGGRAFRGVTAGLFAVILQGAAGLYAAAPLNVPPGFSIQRVAGPPQIQFPMFVALDSERRLYVTESSGGDLYDELQKSTRSCRISRLEDRDRDGIYEVAGVFADKLTPSMGLAWHSGKLYAADPPDLVTLEDTDGDGRADRRKVILTGFGHTDNGSLHGLIFGPDDWLYFTMGNPDGYDLRGPDGSIARGKTGALIRCRPGGERVETVAHGFDNLIEITFLPDASIIGTLNWYQLPDRGLRDALAHILEGSQFPLHPFDPLVPHPQFNTVLPPLASFPAVAHSGLELYRGAAFPAEMRANLFSAQHNTRKIARHRLTPQRASYSVETFDFVTTEDPDVHFSDLVEDAGGSLLIVDTGSWYVQHCPTGRIRQAPARGGIYRVSFRATASSTNSVEQAKQDRAESALLEKLRGTDSVAAAAAARTIGRRGQTNAVPELMGLLGSTNLQLRLAAAEALTHCGSEHSGPALIAALADETDEFLEHALLFALHKRAGRELLLSSLDHPNSKVQRAALLLLDRNSSGVPSEAVVRRLNANDPHLKNAARWVLLRHPEWGEAGAAFLRQLIEQPNASNADREALSQLLPRFQTNQVVLSTIAQVLVATNTPNTETQGKLLLELLAAAGITAAPDLLAEALLHVLESGSAALRSRAIRAAGVLHVKGAEKPLALIASDLSQPNTLRLEAWAELVRRRPVVDAAGMDFLLGELAVTNAPGSRLLAAEALGNARLNPGQASAFLKKIRGDSLITPASVVAALERNGLVAECSVALLDYLNASLDAGWTVPLEQLLKVQAAVPEAERARVEKLLAKLEASVAQQRRQLSEFEPLLNGGDYVGGEKIFFEKAQCTVCHRVWENGGRVGPDLTNIGSIRAGRDILEALALPSSTIAQGYETLTVTTRDFETYTGVQVGKSQEPLVLRLASGSEITLHPHQIERVDRSKLSLMPDGLLQTLTREEIRDLLGFLQRLK